MPKKENKENKFYFNSWLSNLSERVRVLELNTKTQEVVSTYPLTSEQSFLCAFIILQKKFPGIYGSSDISHCIERTLELGNPNQRWNKDFWFSLVANSLSVSSNAELTERSALDLICLTSTAFNEFNLPEFAEKAIVEIESNCLEQNDKIRNLLISLLDQGLSYRGEIKAIPIKTI